LELRCWGTVSNNGLDFEFHNYRYESRGKGHMEKTRKIGYKTYLEGFFSKTSVDNKKVNYPRHSCNIYR